MWRFDKCKLAPDRFVSPEKGCGSVCKSQSAAQEQGAGRPRAPELACARGTNPARQRVEVRELIAGAGGGGFQRAAPGLCGAQVAMGHLWLLGISGLWGLLLCAAEPRTGNPFGEAGRHAGEVSIDTVPAPGVLGEAGPPGTSPGPKMWVLLCGEARLQGPGR